MSASPFLSKLYPGIAGGEVTIPAADTGIVVITTGLREVRSATAVIKADTFAANEEADVAVNWGGSLNPGEIRVAVEKGGTNHGDAADSDVTIAFTAIGDR